jgi:hypothetical protein
MLADEACGVRITGATNGLATSKDKFPDATLGNVKMNYNNILNLCNYY